MPARQSLYVELSADVSRFTAGMTRASTQVSAFGSKVDDLGKRALANEEDLNRLGRGALVMGAALAGGMALATRAAMQWESSWAGVSKTVDGTQVEMAQLQGELRTLAQTLPATHTEIAGVAEAAGQLGVKREAIAAFTRTMIDLGETTNLSAEDAATSIAQMANVMGTRAADVDRLGAALVALGNDGASTEAQILSTAQRLAGAGALIGASEADVLALANAMASVGIEAELGGGAMSRTFQNIYSAVKTGGDALQGFADVAGMSASAFADAFGRDPVRAVDAFVKGLDRIDQQGGNVVQTLDALNISGTQDVSVLLRLKGAGDLLTRSLDTGSAAWRENTALVEEAAKRYDTTEAKTQLARYALNDFAIDIGNVLLPAVAGAAGGIGDLATWLGNLPEPLQQALAVAGTLGATLGLLGGAALIAVPKLAALQASLVALGMDAGKAQAGVSGLSSALGRIGIGIAALVGVDQLGDALADAAPSAGEMTKSLLEFIDSGKAAGALAQVVGRDFSDLGRQLDLAGKNHVIEMANPFGESFIEIKEARRDLEALDQALTGLVASGAGDTAAQVFARIASEAGDLSKSDLEKRFPAYTDALAQMAVEAELAADKTELVGGAIETASQSAGAAYASLDNYTAALGMAEEATEQLSQQTSAWADALAQFVTPLGTYQALLADKEAAERKTAEETAAATASATDSWEDYAADVSLALSEYLAALDEQVQAQADWSTNMLRLSSRVAQSTLDELARMGPEGAPLIAQLVTASDAELKRLEGLFATRTAAATGALAEQLTLAQPVLTAVAASAGQKTADALARELAAGTTTVAAIAQQYGVSVAGGIIPPVSRAAAEVSTLRRGLEGLDGHNVTLTVHTRYVTTGLPGAHTPRLAGVGGGLREADGGVVDYYAAGGLREQHVAQVAPAGAWRVWAEPETGGEAYIPLADSKRVRSVNVLADVAERFGMRLEQYADGGLAGRRTSTALGPRAAAGGGGISDRQMDRLADRVSTALAQSPRPITINATQAAADAREIVDEAVFAARLDQL